MSTADMQARDADRDAAIRRLNDACLEGHLDAGVRDGRVARARAATSASELAWLTRDLQDLPPTPRRRRHRRVLVAALACVIVLTASVLLAQSLRGSDDTSVAAAAAPPVVHTSHPAAAPVLARPTNAGTSRSAPMFPLSVKQLREFRRAYETEFGTTRTRGLIITGQSMLVEVPASGPGQRRAVWEYNGTAFEQGSRELTGEDPEVVDLRWLDVEALIANIKLARKTLGVGGAKLVDVRFGEAELFDGRPALGINVANAEGEGAHLQTSPGGERSQSWDYTTVPTP